MKIYEQADQSSTAICGAVYSWILDHPPLNDRRDLAAAGWKPLRGRVFVTSDPDLVVTTAHAYGLDVETNGTHDVLNVPGILCIP